MHAIRSQIAKVRLQTFGQSGKFSDTLTKLILEKSKQLAASGPLPGPENMCMHYALVEETKMSCLHRTGARSTPSRSTVDYIEVVHKNLSFHLLRRMSTGL